MNAFAKLSFAAALALGAMSALPANAADVVVKLGGKSADQISLELEKAAKSVCRDEMVKATLMSLTECIEIVFNDAVAQLPPTIVIPTR